MELRLTRVKYPFFAIAPQGKKYLKKIPRVGRKTVNYEVAMCPP
jgi:hypothetical protein